MKRHGSTVLKGLWLTGTLAIIGLALGLITHTSPATAAISNYQTLGFNSPTEMINYLTLDSGTIEEIPTSKSTLRIFENLSNTAPGTSTTGESDTPIDPSQIIPWITLGEKLWALIAANKPVAHVETKRAFVLPTAEQDWNQMENWKGPAAQTYRLDYKNLYGMSVITHVYTLAFNYGGTYNDAGHFLANVTMIPGKVSVAWGYTLNTSVEVGSAVNTGSKSDPIPGLEMELTTQVDTIVKHNENRTVFFVKGDGTFQQVTP